MRIVDLCSREADVLITTVELLHLGSNYVDKHSGPFLRSCARRLPPIAPDYSGLKRDSFEEKL